MRCRMFISEISLIFHQKNSEEKIYDRFSFVSIGKLISFAVKERYISH